MKENQTVASIKVVVLYALLFLGFFGGFFVLKAVMGTEYPIMIVVSESMEPTLGVGDYIFIRNPGDINSINVGSQGDIIVFLKPSSAQIEYVVHRAIAKYNKSGVVYFRTKGDNNPTADWWEVPASNIIGTVYGRAPLFGYFSLFERVSGGIATLIILIAIIFFIDYIIPPKEAENPTVSSSLKRRNLVYLTAGLLLVSALPYPLLFFIKDRFVFFEVAALLCWYASDLLLPLAVRDEDNSLMLWLYQFALVIIPLGTDLIYRLTGITPSDWWTNAYTTVPLIWGFSNETALCYRYLAILGGYLIPGCLLFFLSWGMRRRGQPLIKI
jgi:signal peptidase